MKRENFALAVRTHRQLYRQSSHLKSRITELKGPELSEKPALAYFRATQQLPCWRSKGSQPLLPVPSHSEPSTGEDGLLCSRPCDNTLNVKC